jgi:hypothetical protein
MIVHICTIIGRSMVGNVYKIIGKCGNTYYTKVLNIVDNQVYCDYGDLRYGLDSVEDFGKYNPILLKGYKKYKYWIYKYLNSKYFSPS